MKKSIKIVFLMLAFLLICCMTKVLAADEEQEEIEWTDFSEAVYKLEQNNFTWIQLEIYNVEYNSEHSYKFFITNNTTEPSLKEGYFTIDKGSMPIANATANLAKYAELNQDIYLWISEYFRENEKFVVKAQKLERPDYKKFTDAFSNSVLSKNKNWIQFNLPVASNGNRTINLKIGEIKDNKILKDIKDGKSEAWNSLESYAKTGDTIYNKRITFQKIENEESLFNLSLKNDAYYFIYVEFDSENGKYYPIDHVLTIGQARVSNTGDDKWWIFPYGETNFKWNLEETEEKQPEEKQPEEKKETTKTEKDDTIAKKDIPNAGKTTIGVIFIAIVAGIAIIAYKKNKELKGI